jgi:WD40 repeat protein
MAPEQVQSHSESVGPAADIYALGSILYEMLAGRPPFEAETPILVMGQLVHDEPLSPSRLRPRLPADLVTICLKCLEKSPRRRYASARALADDLQRYRTGKPILARPVGAFGRAYRWCQRRPLVAGLWALCTALAVAFVATVLVYHIRLTHALEQSQTVARDEHHQIIDLNLTLGTIALENGDAYLAALRFSEVLRLEEGDGESERNNRLRIAAALRQGPHLLKVAIHDGPVVCARLGSSSGWVVTSDNDNTLEVWDVLTGRTTGTPLKLDEAPRDAAISADGRMLATVGAGGRTLVWDVGTGLSVALPTQETEAVSHVAFPLGGRVLLTMSADSGMQVWSLTADQPMRLWSLHGSTENSSALSEDGHWLFKRNPAGMGQLWDTATGKGAASLKWEQPVTQTAVSSDGRRLALVAEDGSLRIWDVAAGEWLTGAMQFASDIRHIEFSPDDGLLLAVTDNSARVWNARTGQRVTPPLRLGGPLAAASFAENGRQVLAISQRGTVGMWKLRQPDEADHESIADERSVDDIVELARVLACARIDNQHREGLDEKAFRDSWSKMHRAH